MPVETDIVVSIRTRPGMYVGDTQELGLSHVVTFALDVICNSTEMRQAEVSLQISGRSVRIESTRPPPTLDALRQALESPNTALSAKSNFPWEAVASSTLCSRFVLDAQTGSGRIRLECARGVARSVESRETASLVLELQPDDEIFDRAVRLDANGVVKRATELAAVLPGLRMDVRDSATGRISAARYPAGMADFAAERGGGSSIPTWSTQLQLREVSVDAAIHFPWSFSRRLEWLSFANTVPTLRGGSHLRGLEAALRFAAADRFERIRDTTLGAISVHAPREQIVFDGPIKDLLRLPWLEQELADAIEAPLRAHLEKHGRLG
jgi:DNA gyrase/topoisomerase IV subunit B